MIKLAIDVEAQDAVRQISTDKIQIEVPIASNLQELSLVDVGDSYDLPKFSASKE